MSSKDFIALADALRGLNVPADVLNALCEFCSSQNHRFNRERFLAYLAGECVPRGGPLKRDPKTGKSSRS